MKDLRIKQNKNNKKSKFKFYFFSFLKKKKWWIIGIVLFSIIILFPNETGRYIGQWIHDFIGNIVKYSKF